MSISALITGSTGMVGKGVLIECLEHPEVETVTVINRRKLDLKHPKLKEIICQDLSDLSGIKNELMKDINACFHCMGVSSIGLNEKEFTKLTYDISYEIARTVYEMNPDAVFNYVSGTGTDSSEKGRVMWARVKGRTENMILGMGFKDAYAFRPGFILPLKGVKSSTGWYNAIYTVLRPFFPLIKISEAITTSVNVGLAMINSVRFPQELKFLENSDINALASKSDN